MAHYSEVEKTAILENIATLDSFYKSIPLINYLIEETKHLIEINHTAERIDFYVSLINNAVKKSSNPKLIARIERIRETGKRLNKTLFDYSYVYAV